MSKIPRKPIPKSRHNSVIEQEPDEAQSSKETGDFGATSSEVDEAPTKLSWQNRPHELPGSQDTKQSSRAYTVEDFIDDDESARDASLEPPPVYQPSEIDINQEGLHARATAACESTHICTFDNPMKYR